MQDVNPDYVSTREYDGFKTALNGQLNRIEKSVDEVKGMLRTNQNQFADLIEHEVRKRETCAESHDTRMSAIETTVNEHDNKLVISKWVWRGVVAFVGLTLALTPIILSVTHII